MLSLILLSCMGCGGLLFGCGPDATPVTQCHWYLVGDDDVAGLNQAEDAIMSHAPLGTCWATDHWTVYVVRAAFNVQKPDGGRGCAVGATYCDSRVMKVYKQPFENWGQTALAHEVFHAIDCPVRNYEHTGWSADGGVYDRVADMRLDMVPDGGTVVRDTSPDGGYANECY